MYFTSVVLISLSCAGLLNAASLGHQHAPHKRQDVQVLRRQNGGSATCLNANAVQTAAALTGQEAGTDGIKPGQAPSATDPANFINFCSGQTLTNGKQINAGSCNGIPMGKIPAATNMISAIILNPAIGVTIPSDTTFNVSVQVQGLTAGSFTNPLATYYNAPQNLDRNGNIIGHCHVTIQAVGNSPNPSTPPDPSKFAFFKGIDDAGNNRGLLQATVGGGLPVGFYRVCTMISSSNHQPVLMPVAQRGAQDDCTKFEVVASGNNNNNNNNNNGGSQPTNTAIKTLASVTSIQVAPTGNGGASEVVKIKSGTLGGEAPFVVASGDSQRPFSVNGNTFTDAASAVERSCSIQFNLCADAFNRGALPGRTLKDCDDQKAGCTAE